MPPWRAAIFTTLPGSVQFGGRHSAGIAVQSRLVRLRTARVFNCRPAGVQVAKRAPRQRIAITGLGGTSEVVLRIGLEAAGENPKDFVIIGLGAAQLISGLESGSIEAANLTRPFYTSPREKGFASFSTLARMPRCRWAVSLLPTLPFKIAPRS